MGTLPNPDPDPIPPPNPDPDPPEPRNRRHDHPSEITCGFCGCRLTTTRGEVLRMSPDAVTLRDSERVITDLKREVETLKLDNASLREKLQPAPANKRKTINEEYFS